MISASDLQTRIVTAGVASGIGQSVTYTPTVGAASTFRAVPRIDSIETLTETGAPARVRRIELVVPSASVAAPVRHDAILMSGVTYLVTGVVADGTAAWRLTLSTRTG